MPYYISDTAEGCDGWATVKEDGEVMGCHTTKQDAIDQAVAIALAEDSTFEGERSENRELPDNYRPATSDDVPEGRACGNCIFFNEEDVAPDGRARCTRWDEYVEGGAYCNAWEPREDASYDEDEEEQRQVDLSPPAYMRASARRGLVWHEAGLSGDGLLPATVREARAMSNGSMTADKWVRTRAFIARHLVDMDAPANTPGDDNYPGPGAVAMALWGGGGSKRSAERALAYAEGVVARIEAENEGRAKGQALSKMETRTNPAQFEVRETEEGMTFSGYAAVFNSDSLPLPFTERIAPGAFRGSLRNRNDIKLLWNHDSGQPLASTRAGNLRLTEDERGLYVEATLADTTVGRDARELISKGIVDSMSFGFTVARNGEEWSEDGQVRTLTKISLHEVSIVSFPAYPATAGSTAVRGLDKVAKRAEVDADELADALLKIENGEDITSADRNIINTVLEKLSPAEVEPEKPLGDFEMLALKKKKLDLLMKGI
jgi:HK97 family phage prohead protease